MALSEDQMNAIMGGTQPQSGGSDGSQGLSEDRMRRYMSGDQQSGNDHQSGDDESWGHWLGRQAMGAVEGADRVGLQTVGLPLTLSNLAVRGINRAAGTHFNPGYTGSDLVDGAHNLGLLQHDSHADLGAGGALGEGVANAALTVGSLGTLGLARQAANTTGRVAEGSGILGRAGATARNVAGEQADDLVANARRVVPAEVLGNVGATEAQHAAPDNPWAQAGAGLAGGLAGGLTPAAIRQSGNLATAGLVASGHGHLALPAMAARSAARNFSHRLRGDDALPNAGEREDLIRGLRRNDIDPQEARNDIERAVSEGRVQGSQGDVFGQSGNEGLMGQGARLAQNSRRTRQAIEDARTADQQRFSDQLAEGQPEGTATDAAQELQRRHSGIAAGQENRRTRAQGIRQGVADDLNEQAPRQDQYEAAAGTQNSLSDLADQSYRGQSQMWDRLRQHDDTALDVPNTVNRVRDELGDESWAQMNIGGGLPQRNAFRRMMDDAGQVGDNPQATVRDIRDLRSELQRRRFAGGTTPDQARRLGNIVDGLDQDISNGPRQIQQDYNAARNATAQHYANFGAPRGGSQYNNPGLGRLTNRGMSASQSVGEPIRNAFPSRGPTTGHRARGSLERLQRGIESQLTPEQQQAFHAAGSGADPTAIATRDPQLASAIETKNNLNDYLSGNFHERLGYQNGGDVNGAGLNLPAARRWLDNVRGSMGQNPLTRDRFNQMEDALQRAEQGDTRALSLENSADNYDPAKSLASRFVTGRNEYADNGVYDDAVGRIVNGDGNRSPGKAINGLMHQMRHSPAAQGGFANSVVQNIRNQLTDNNGQFDAIRFQRLLSGEPNGRNEQKMSQALNAALGHGDLGKAYRNLLRETTRGEAMVQRAQQANAGKSLNTGARGILSDAINGFARLRSQSAAWGAIKRMTGIEGAQAAFAGPSMLGRLYDRLRDSVGTSNLDQYMSRAATNPEYAQRLFRELSPAMRRRMYGRLRGSDTIGTFLYPTATGSANSAAGSMGTQQDDTGSQGRNTQP